MKCFEINDYDLVPGDIVEVSSGNMVPADMVLIKELNIKVQNREDIEDSQDALKLTNNEKLLFFGSKCINGSGVGIVFNVGDRTVLG